jgi:hypothetical protein
MLDYLLTTRWGASRYLGNYAPLNDMLVTATTGQDATSQELAAAMTKIVAGEVSDAFDIATNGSLQIKSREAFDRYAPLSYPLARAIAANVDQLSQLLLNRATFGEVSAKDMSYALVLATSNDAGFEALVGAQTEHMRAALETAPPVGLNVANAERLGYTEAYVKEFDDNGSGQIDQSDVMQFLTDRAVEEARPFSQIVEIRAQVLIAQGLDAKKADESLKSMVGNAIGLIPVPGAKQVGELATGAFRDLVSAGYDKLAGAAYDEVAQQVAQRMSAHGRGLDEVYRTLADNREAVERLGEQMLATALLTKGMLDNNMAGRIFVTGDPPTVKPFGEMSPREYSDFLVWARDKNGSSDLLDRFRGTLGNVSDVNTHLKLNLPSSTGGGK